MTVKAEITSTLNGQSANLILIEDGDTRSYESKALSGGTETLVFTELDGGSDKEYTAKIVPSTSDVTQTTEVNYGATVDIDSLPHREADAAETISSDTNFSNGVGARDLALGENALVNGLLTAALNDGEVLADDGFVYSSVQAAENAASSWIFIGPGTFNEALTFDTAGMDVIGSGYNTLLDAGAGRHTISAQNVTVKNVRAQNTPGRDTFDPCFSITANDCTVDNCWMPQSDSAGVRKPANNIKVVNCTFGAVEGAAITNAGSDGIGGIYANNTIDGAGTGIVVGSDEIVANNTVLNVSSQGLQDGTTDRTDNIIIGNRVHNVGDDGIEIFGADNIIANNRVSNSGASDIADSGSGTLLDSNLTGASN